MSYREKELFELILDEIYLLVLKWQIYTQLFGTSEENIELLNEFSPICFGIYQTTLLDDIVLSICRLTDVDNRNKNLSIEELYKIFSAGEYSGLYKRLESIYKSIKLRSTIFRNHRNKRIGHNDINTIKSGYENINGINRKEITEVIEEFFRFVNEISIYFEQTDLYAEVIGLEGKDGEALTYHLHNLSAFYKENEGIY